MRSVDFVRPKLTDSVFWRRHTVVAVHNYTIIRKDLNSARGGVTKLGDSERGITNGHSLDDLDPLSQGCRE